MLPELTTVTRTQGNNEALKDGTVTPRTCRLNFAEVTPLTHAFRRMVRGLEFDVCEMAFTTYLCARAHGKRLTALPVFLVRAMHHGAIVRNARAGICGPGDLEGRRVGLSRGYTVTTGVWARGILQDDYGVDLSRVTWIRGSDEHVAEYRPPANVLTAGQGGEVREMLITRELPAAIGVPADHPDIVPLIASPEEAGFEALRRHGLYPINHLVVVRDDVLDALPGLAGDLFGAFAEAKNRYVERLRDGAVKNPTAADATYRRVMALIGDPLPYGVEPNREMIGKLIDHAVRQRILDRAPPLASLFHPGTLSLAG